MSGIILIAAIIAIIACVVVVGFLAGVGFMIWLSRPWGSWLGGWQ